MDRHTPVRPPAESAPLFSTVAIVASCAGFVLIGALQSLYGPVIPALRSDFGLSPTSAGLALSAHFIGGVTGVLVFDRVHGRVGNRLLLGTSYALMALGSAGFALAPDWPLALLSALITGLGFGGIDYGLNQLFAHGFGRRSPAMLNVLNAHFGVGAIAGPALIGLFGARHYTGVFLAFAVLALCPLPFLKGVRDRDGDRDSDHDGEPAGSAKAPVTGSGAPSALRRTGPLLAAFVLLYVLHVGVEAGVGGWEPTHLEAVGYGTAFAASLTSVYWLMMTIGRFLVAPLTLRYAESVIITVSCAGMAACLSAATVPDLAPYAYAGVGLFIAPIFPTGLPWLQRAVPAARHAGALVIAASMIGGVAAGPVLGSAIELSGVRAVPVLLLLMAACCLAATRWLTRAIPAGGLEVAKAPVPVGTGSGAGAGSGVGDM